tara:strand:+ start:208 stop:1569 length:1362 start_codon:yes stop_codon:yes gene_type:complete
MATTFKTFLNSDIVTTKTLLHEAIPITGALVSGTYNRDGSLGTELNIKNYAHGMFQSVFDYPYLSSSANHIFDISVGYSTGSLLSGNIKQVARTEQEKKIQVYNQMAQVLMGHNEGGHIRRFDQNGELTEEGTGISVTGKINEAFFLNFSRLLTKDEIKKGSFTMTLGVSPHYGSADSPDEIHGDLRKYSGRTITIKDTNAENEYKINSPAGEYGILSASSTQASGAIAHGSTTGSLHPTKPGNIGLIFYQAGVVVLDARVFAKAYTFNAQGKEAAGGSGGAVNRFVTASTTEGGGHHGSAAGNPTIYALTGGILNSASCMMHKQIVDAAGNDITAFAQADVYGLLTGSSIQTACDSLRHRILNVSFNNTTELNSTVYFCRAHHNEFNYSGNPTYLQDSQIRVKNVPSDMPVSYITSVGLYSPDNELLAVAKLSEPLRKDPTNELTLRVRLDY